MKYPPLPILLIVIISLAGSAYAATSQPRFLKIGTGSISGTYFVMGGLLANILSNPPGSRPCDVGGSCGVPNLIVVTQATEGSGENLAKLQNGSLDIALVQGDMVHFAAHGLGDFRAKPLRDVRLIAHLYYDAVHIVVRADSTIQTLPDLRGKRVVMGDTQSGTTGSARLILEAYGLGQAITPIVMKPEQAADALAADRIDAFFFVGGQPVPFIVNLAQNMRIRLLPLDGDAAARLLQNYSFFSQTTLAKGTYDLDDTVPTLSVSAQLVTTAKQPYYFMRDMTQALWHPTNLATLRRGHKQGQQLSLDTAISPATITLHAGAERFYREQGLIPEPLPPTPLETP